MIGRYRLFFLLLILILTFICYSNVLVGEFHFDDSVYINEHNLKITLPSTHFERGVLSSLISDGRLLTSLSFSLNYALGGMNVTGYHTFNILIHLMMVVVMYMCIRKTLFINGYEQIFKDRAYWIALISAGIFALHPIQTETVSYIVQRAESMASLMYLMSLYAFVMYCQKEGNYSFLFWLLGVVFFFLGWMSKAIVITIPAIFMLYVIYFMGKDRLKKAVMGMAPILVIGLFLSFKTISGFEGKEDVGFDIAGLGQPEYLYTGMRVMITYLRLIVLPINQNLDYDYEIYRELFNINVIASLFFWSSTIICGIYALKYEGRWKYHLRIIFFGFLWFLVILSPTSIIVPLKDVIFEHRVYLASIGIFSSLIIFLDMIVRRLEPKWPNLRKYAVLLAFVSIFFLGGATCSRNAVWKDDVSLWEDVANKSPQKTRVHYNLGNAYFKKGNMIKAIKAWEKAVELEPHNSLALNQLGNVYYMSGSFDMAKQYYLKSLESYYKNAEAHYNLAVIFEKKTDYKEAIRHYEVFLELGGSEYALLIPEVKKRIAVMREKL